MRYNTIDFKIKASVVTFMPSIKTFLFNSTRWTQDPPPLKKNPPTKTSQESDFELSSENVCLTVAAIFSACTLYFFQSASPFTHYSNTTTTLKELPHGPLTCLQTASSLKISPLISLYINDLCQEMTTSRTNDAFNKFKVIKEQLQTGDLRSPDNAADRHLTTKAVNSPHDQFLPEYWLEESSVIHKAAYLNNGELIKSYKERKNSVNKLDHLQRTPLHYAALRGHAQAVRALIIKGANPNLGDISQNTPLHDALVQDPNREVIQHLLYGGANPSLLNYRGFSALDLVNRTGDLSLIAMLDEGLITYQSKIRQIEEEKITLDLD